MLIQPELGRRIRLYRAYTGIVQKQLSDKWGLAQQTLSNLENGLSMGDETMIRVYNLLAAEPEYFSIKKIDE